MTKIAQIGVVVTRTYNAYIEVPDDCTPEEVNDLAYQIPTSWLHENGFVTNAEIEYAAFRRWPDSLSHASMNVFPLSEWEVNDVAPSEGDDNENHGQE